MNTNQNEKVGLHGQNHERLTIQCNRYIVLYGKITHLKWLGRSFSLEQALIHGNTIKRTFRTHFMESSQYKSEIGVTLRLTDAWTQLNSMSSGERMKEQNVLLNLTA